MALTIDGQQELGLDQWFRYDSQSIVNEITPTIGYTTGGIKLAVSGSSFMQSDILLQLQRCVLNATFISSTLIECPLPHYKKGQYFVRIIREIDVEGVRMISRTNALFDVREPVQISHIEPSVGPIDESIALKVSGTGFHNVETLSCKFERSADGASAIVAAQFISPELISCSVPDFYPKFATIVKIFQ